MIILDFSKTDKWQEMLVDLGTGKSEHKKFFEVFKQFSQNIYTGKMNLEEFTEIVKSKFDIDVPSEYSMLDDFANRFEANPSLTPIITKLSKRYKLGLLTTQYLGMLDKIKERGIFPEVKWDVIVDSSIVGFCKPQDEIFKLAEEKSSVAPKNILFIENSEKHIQVAKKRGWQTLLYNPANVVHSNERLVKMLDT